MYSKVRRTSLERKKVKRRKRKEEKTLSKAIIKIELKGLRRVLAYKKGTGRVMENCFHNDRIFQCFGIVPENIVRPGAMLNIQYAILSLFILRSVN